MQGLTRSRTLARILWRGALLSLLLLFILLPMNTSASLRSDFHNGIGKRSMNVAPFDRDYWRGRTTGMHPGFEMAPDDFSSHDSRRPDDTPLDMHLDVNERPTPSSSSSSATQIAPEIHEDKGQFVNDLETSKSPVEHHERRDDDDEEFVPAREREEEYGEAQAHDRESAQERAMGEYQTRPPPPPTAAAPKVPWIPTEPDYRPRPRPRRERNGGVSSGHVRLDDAQLEIGREAVEDVHDQNSLRAAQENLIHHKGKNKKKIETVATINVVVRAIDEHEDSYSTMHHDQADMAAAHVMEGHNAGAYSSRDGHAGHVGHGHVHALDPNLNVSPTLGHDHAHHHDGGVDGGQRVSTTGSAPAAAAAASGSQPVDLSFLSDIDIIKALLPWILKGKGKGAGGNPLAAAAPAPAPAPASAASAPAPGERQQQQHHEQPHAQGNVKHGHVDHGHVNLGHKEPTHRGHVPGHPGNHGHLDKDRPGHGRSHHGPVH